MTDQSLPVAKTRLSRWEILRTSKQWQQGLRHVLSYIVLILGSLFMLFPMLWMVSASLKPQWQIFANPPIWIPQHWEQVQAGSTNRQIDEWSLTIDGQPQNVIQIGTRKYTTVIDASLLSHLQTAPSSEVGSAQPTTLDNGITLNVRDWKGQPVVALARSGDGLVVAALDDLRSAVLRLPLDVVNGGQNTSLTIEGVDFRGRSIPGENDASRSVIPIGPESQLTIVSSPDVAASATIVPADSIQDAGYTAVGQTELKLETVGSDPTKYVELVSESWQPIINEDELEASAFVASAAQMGERSAQQVNGMSVQVARYTPASGDPL